jgi:hypothetical protein
MLVSLLETRYFVNPTVGVRIVCVCVGVKLSDSESDGDFWGEMDGWEDTVASDCDRDVLEDVGRGFELLGFFARVSKRGIRRSSSHCLTATSSSSPLSPSATKPAIFAHLVSSMEGMRVVFNLPLPLSFSLPSGGGISPSSPSFAGKPFARLRTLRRLGVEIPASLTLSLALAPGRKRQSG